MELPGGICCVMEYDDWTGPNCVVPWIPTVSLTGVPVAAITIPNKVGSILAIVSSSAFGPGASCTVRALALP